jgi:PAS domain S-box-containing protein
MAVEAVVVADASGEIRYWSAGAEALFGYSAGEAVGHSLDLIVPDDYRHRHWAGFHRAMATGECRIDRATMNIPVRCRDGAVRSFPGRFVFLADPHGCGVGAAAIYGERAGGEEPFTPLR